MDLMSNITLNLYSITFLVLIYVHSIKYQDNISLNSKIYFIILRITLVLLVVDSFSRFDGNPESLYLIINSSGNFLLFLLSPLLLSL